jgi:alpha-1,2-mannosyltransferase
LAYTVVQLVLNRYTGGGSFFGYRIGLEMLAGLTPALALSAYRMGAVARRFFGPVALLQLMVFTVGAFSDAAAFPDRDDRWTHNEFLPYVAQVPAAASALMVLALIVGILVWRLYGDPRFRTDAVE